VMEAMTWVGLDVDARSTQAAALMLPSGELRGARFDAASEAIVTWLQRLPQPVRACYEAGPTGFVLYRALEAAGINAEVVAPTKTPRTPGDRVKSDRGDAELLARLLPTGSLRPIAVPSREREGARDLTRAREQLRVDLCRARHRVSKLLLRYGRVYPEKTTWTQAHRRWLAGQSFDDLNTELAYLDYLAAVDGLVARRQALDERLSRLALERQWWPTIARLRCFPGIDTLSALILCLEVGDFARFRSPRQLASWLGLVPSLNQSGESSQQGRITKTGSRDARRILVEAAWQYNRRPAVGASLAGRHQGRSTHVLRIAWRCQHRLYRLHRPLSQRRKPGNVVTVALARPLACSLWAPPWPRNQPRPAALAREAPGPGLPARAIRLWAGPRVDARI
jgi:transposase